MAERGPGPILLDRYAVIGPHDAPRRWGDTLLATDQRFGRVVDLVTSPDPLHTPAGALFAWRARTVGGLRHPLLPMMYDLGQQDEHVVLVVQHVAGQPLLESIAREWGAWPLVRVLRLTEDLAVALGLAHTRGVCHGALGAQSVIVDADGVPALVDLAWPQTERGAAPHRVAFDARARQEQSLRGDVFALGRLLPRMIDAARIAEHSALSAGVADLLEDALAARPDERFADGAEMATAIKALLDGSPAVRPTAARRPGTPAPATPAVGAPPRGAFKAIQPAPAARAVARRDTHGALMPLAVGASIAAIIALGAMTHAPLRGGWTPDHGWHHTPAPWARGRFDGSFHVGRFPRSWRGDSDGSLGSPFGGAAHGAI